MKISWILSGLLLIVSACSQNKKQDETPQAGRVEQSRERNPGGIVFSYQKIEEIQTPEGPKEDYRLSAANLPIGRQFVLMGKTFVGKEDLLYEFTVDSQGRLATADSNGIYTLEDIRFRLGEFRCGEPYVYSLESRDGQISVSATIVPYPIESKGGAAKVSMVIASPDAKLFLCQGKGFEPREHLLVRSKSDTEEATKSVVATDRGEFTLQLEPAIRGRKGGLASAEVLRTSETLFVQFPWGKEAMEIYRGSSDTSAP